jgi:CheY-like chemotaxis protein
MRVLAFEDSHDILALLTSDGIDCTELTLQQQWNSENAIAIIKNFAPNIVLLDHFMPPLKGLEVLLEINDAVAAGELQRPELIIGISSATFANQAMMKAGADQVVVKFNLASLDIWPKQ